MQSPQLREAQAWCMWTFLWPHLGCCSSLPTKKAIGCWVWVRPGQRPAGLMLRQAYSWPGRSVGCLGTPCWPQVVSELHCRTFGWWWRGGSEQDDASRSRRWELWHEQLCRVPIECLRGVPVPGPLLFCRWTCCSCWESSKDFPNSLLTITASDRKFFS